MRKKSGQDQFFLVDEAILLALVAAAELQKNDQVLEVGAGQGIITRPLARVASHVLAVEIDRQFQKDLNSLPPNVTVFWGDILKILAKRPKFNKIIGNLPSSIVEPLFQCLKTIKFDLAVFLVPLKFANKLLKDWPYILYFKSELIQRVEKTAFQPQPKTAWALVRIYRYPEPLIAGDYERFAQQYLFEHPQAKLKNALMEIVLKIFQAKGKLLTKNEARALVEKMGLTEEEKEKLVAQFLTQNPPQLKLWRVFLLFKR